MLDLSDVRLDRLDAFSSSPTCERRDEATSSSTGDEYLQRLLYTRVSPHVQNFAAFESLQRDRVLDQMGKAWILDAVLQSRKQHSFSIAPPGHVYEQLHAAVYHLAPYTSSSTTVARYGSVCNLVGYLALDHAGRIEAYERLRTIGSEAIERKTRKILDSPNPRRYAETLLGFTQDLIYTCRLMPNLVSPAVRSELRGAQETVAHGLGSLSWLELEFLRWRNHVLLALYAPPPRE